MRTRFLIPLLLMPIAANSAQPVSYKRILNGTGFLINHSGHIITNAHVVNNCQSISVLIKNKEKIASIVAVDQKNDFAALRVNFTSKHISSLRYNIADIMPGDDVIIMGYPGNDGANGKQSYKKTKILSLYGPAGETQHIQLSSVSEKGNSGGPVLDLSGNVIGIIYGMAKTYNVDANGTAIGEAIKQTDVAITLQALSVFLQQHHIQSLQSTSSNIAHSDKNLRMRALEFTVAVRCVQENIPIQGN